MSPNEEIAESRIQEALAAGEFENLPKWEWSVTAEACDLMEKRDQTLLARFEAGEIPLEEWNQRTHVAIAFLYLREFGHDGALQRMRDGVKKINLRHGVEESQFSGYNETTTVAFLKIVEAVRLAYDAMLPAATADEFCDLHPELMNKHILRLFYSPDRRGHNEAKARFVEPDLAPLPVHQPGDA